MTPPSSFESPTSHPLPSPVRPVAIFRGAYLHTCIPAYLHTCIPAYLHTSCLQPTGSIEAPKPSGPALGSGTKRVLGISLAMVSGMHPQSIYHFDPTPGSHSVVIYQSPTTSQSHHHPQPHDADSIPIIPGIGNTFTYLLTYLLAYLLT